MRHPIPATLLLAAIVTALAACSSAPKTPARASTGAPQANAVTTTPASATAPSVAPQPTVAAPSASQPSVTPASPTVPFPSSAGLEQLDSYEMTLRISFSGTEGGQTVESTEYYTHSFSLDPDAQFTTIQTPDEDGKPSILMQGRVGDVEYARVGLDEPCTARTATSTSHHIFNPVVLLKPIRYGQDKGQETIKGLPTHHYVMDTLRNAETEMSGEVWIAEKSAYVVKYALHVKGGEQYFGKGNKGEQTLAFELSDVGTKKKGAFPDGCLPPITDLPAMPDATNVTRSLSELSYTTAADVAKTAAFYQEQMQALGWTAESVPTNPGPPPSSVPSIPNLPQLPQIPGVDLRKYLPTAVPTVAAPAPQTSWLVFRLASEQRRVHITLKPEGDKLRVLAEIVQE